MRYGGAKVNGSTELGSQRTEGEISRSDTNWGAHGFQWWMPKPDGPAVPQQEEVQRAAQTG